jgi:hypothetical protein
MPFTIFAIHCFDAFIIQLSMPENIDKSDDYISIDLIKKVILDFFRLLFKLLEFIIISIQRRLGLFIFCCLLGLVSGYFYYWQKPGYYKTEMIIQSNDLSKKAYHEIVGNLNDLINSRSYAAFSSQLKIDQQIGKQVISIEARSITNGSLNSDTSIRMRDPFKIQLRTSNISSIPVLQNALLSYLKNSPYLRLIKEGEKKIYTEKLTFINYEQKRLDSLISDYHKAVAAMKMPTTFYNNAIDPAALYQHALKLDSIKEKAQRWLNSESEAVLLIDGFKSPANPQSISLAILLVIGLNAGLIIGLFLCILLKMGDKLKMIKT